LYGDLCSEGFKYYCVIFGGVLLACITIIVAIKNISFANVYRIERLSVYANELIFAYKATKEDILKEENKRL